MSMRGTALPEDGQESRREGVQARDKHGTRDQDFEWRSSEFKYEKRKDGSRGSLRDVRSMSKRGAALLEDG